MIDLGPTKIYVRGREIDPESIKMKIAKMKFQLPEFLQIRLGEIIDEEIVKVVQQKMVNEGFSKKIADGTRVQRSSIKSGVIWKVISDYKAVNGFPVAIMIENGRKAFFLKPKSKKALSWVDKESGKRAYSKGHWIPKFEGRKFIQDTINEKKAIVQQRINKDTENYLFAILGDYPLPVAKIFGQQR